VGGIPTIPSWRRGKFSTLSTKEKEPKRKGYYGWIAAPVGPAKNIQG
jgi:hypothetical protein